MGAVGNWGRLALGPSYHEHLHAASSFTTYVMASLNTGIAFRHVATDTLDYKAVTVYWSAISAPGQVTLRIETVDASTGKPTGTLYDAAATKVFTPTSGLQTITFDSQPTAGRTAGAAYAIVLLTTTGGTTQTLRAYHGSNFMHQGAELAMTASDGTTRSNFADVAQSWPCVSVTMEDDTLQGRAYSPGFQATSTVNSNSVAGGKLYIPAGFTLWGAEFMLMSSASPNSNLKVSLLDCSKEPCAIGAAGYVVASCTLDKDFLTTYNYSSSPRGAIVHFDAEYVVTKAGFYRLVVEKADHAGTVSFTTYSVSFFAAGQAPQYWVRCVSSDVTASPVVWTDTLTDMACVSLLLSDYTAPASGGGNVPAVGGMVARR